jgi:4-amino-4-deoxy-L-arabinose transferase-like glycosyltransferase
MTRSVGAAAPRVRSRNTVGTLIARVPAPLLLGGLVAFVSGLNVWWRTMETRPPHWDMGHHLANSLVYLHGFSLGELPRFFDAYLFYPPLVYWVADIFYAVLGNESIWVAVLSNVVWLGILVFATYGIGRRLWNARVGWLSVVFVLAAPMIVSTSKDYMLDLPLTAVGALSLYLLIRADGFSNRRHSLLFGVCCGCGLLVKWTFPLVMALPVLHATATALSQVRLRRNFRPLLNLAGAAALAFAVAGTWYVHNFRQVVGASLYYSGPEGVAQGNPPVATLGSALWYLWNLLNVQLYLIPLLFALVGIVYCFRHRALASRNVYPLLMVAGTYLMFTLLRHKDPRYTLPMLPALAVVAASWLEYVAAKARAWIETAFIAYSAVAFVAITFGTSLLPAVIAFDVASNATGLSRVAVFQQSGYLTGAPTGENWHQIDPFRTMARLPRSERSFSYHGPDTVWFNKLGLSYYALRYRVRWVLGGGQARFLLARGPQAPLRNGYTRLERWRLPDGGLLALYERAS